MTGHWHGSPPTRDEVLAEIARELAWRRNTYLELINAGKLKISEADERIDRLQAGYDYLMAHWLREVGL